MSYLLEICQLAEMQGLITLETVKTMFVDTCFSELASALSLSFYPAISTEVRMFLSP